MREMFQAWSPRNMTSNRVRLRERYLVLATAYIGVIRQQLGCGMVDGTREILCIAN